MAPLIAALIRLPALVDQILNLRDEIEIEFALIHSEEFSFTARTSPHSGLSDGLSDGL
jgi:hypothetical protein